MVLGVVVLLAGVGGGRTPEASFSALSIGLLLAVSAGFLLNRKSRIPAGLLIGASIFGALMSLRISFGESARYTPGQFEAGLVAMAFCLFLAALAGAR